MALQAKVDKRWYAQFIENLPVGIYRTTLEGRIVFCNWALAQIFGFNSVEELINYPVISLYRNKKDRGVLIETIMNRGLVIDIPLSLTKRDGSPIWCAVTARPVFDEDGMVVLIDGVLREITGEIEEKHDAACLDDHKDNNDGLILLLDLQGNFIDINDSGARFFGFPRKELLGKALFSFMVPKHRDLFPLFLSDILKTGREEGILTIVDNNGLERHIEFHALLVKKNGKSHHIKGLARNVTERIKRQREKLTREKFQGVLEMAGGVAHRLNQPLTIINNTLNELLSDLNSEDGHYQKIVRVHDQIQKVNVIAKKIAGIRKYEAMDYVAGIRIVDIDKAS